MNPLDLGAYASERAYSILLLKLNELIENGAGDSDEADAIRDEMSGYWNSLTEEERQRMRWLSEDLADLEKGGPAIIHTSPDAIRKWKEALNLALAQKEQGRHDDLLAVLRSPAKTELPPSELLFLQARAWDDAGFPEVAIQFLKAAERQDPTTSIHVLNKLQREGYVEEAVQKANTLLNERSSDPLAVYFASAVLLGSVRHLDFNIARPTLERITDPLRKCFQGFSANHPVEAEVPGFKASMGHILGLCLEWLGQIEAAIKVYDQILALYPSNPDTLTMRGLAKWLAEKESAFADLRRAIQHHTKSPWPYILLSRELLCSNNLQAVSLCNQGLNLKPAPSDVTKALLHEGIAIGYAELGQPADRVLENFYLAIDLDPHNDIIRENLNMYRSKSGNYKKQPLDQAKVMSLSVIQSATSQFLGQNRYQPEKTNEDRILRSLELSKF